ncbi:MAG: hypothetical protein FJ288_07550 [Planctomycetes bacterium]|nr:hypothetical protein [Planctomycetota bacterium]
MRQALALVALLSLLGCGNPRAAAPPTGQAAALPADRAADYLDGIARARSDECRTTYDLIVQHREAAVPVVLKALDLYADPAKAPRPQSLILNGAVWAAKLNPDEARNAVVEIMRKAGEHPNSDISSRAKAWLQANEKERL